MADTTVNSIRGFVAQNVNNVSGVSKVENNQLFSDIMAKSLNNNVSAAGSAVKNYNQVYNTDSFKSTESGNLVNNAKTDTVKTDNAISNQDSGKISSAAQKVADKIKEKLGISDEELEESMEILGLTMVDLLDCKNISALLMQLTGTEDAMAFVTDSDLSGIFKDIMDCLDGVLEDLSQTLDVSREDLSALLDSAKEEFALNKENENNSSSAGDVSEDGEYSILENEIDKKLTVGNETSADTSAGKNDLGSSSSSELAGTDNNSGAFTGQVVQNIADSFQNVFEGTVENVNAADVVRQVVDSIKLTATQSLQSMEIQLTPENLGKVNVLVSVREGVITAQLTAESEQVKRALESQLLTLKDNFENQGLKVEAVEITVKNNAFENNNPNFNESRQQEQTSKAKRTIRFDSLDFMEEDSEEVSGNIQMNENSSVEFKA